RAIEVESDYWSRTRGSWWFPPGQALSDPGDSLLSYVKTQALRYCDLTGPDTELSADHIVSLRRYPNRSRNEVFEIILWISNGEEGEGDGRDSTVTDSTGQAEGAEYNHFSFGPLFCVDLSSASQRLFVWVSPFCMWGTFADANTIGRTISQTLHRQEVLSPGSE